MASRDQMRAADADREQVAARVRQALDEGRITLNELDQRLGEAYAARTFGELDQVVADLPAAFDRSQVVAAGGAAPQPRVPPSRHEPAPKLPTWLSLLWRLWLVVVAINLVIWFLVSISIPDGPAYFWPMWVAGPWGAANVGLMIFFPPRRKP